MTVVFMVAVLLIRNFTGYALAIVFLAAAVASSKISPSYIFKSIQALIIYYYIYSTFEPVFL